MIYMSIWLQAKMWEKTFLLKSIMIIWEWSQVRAQYEFTIAPEVLVF